MDCAMHLKEFMHLKMMLCVGTTQHHPSTKNCFCNKMCFCAPEDIALNTTIYKYMSTQYRESTVQQQKQPTITESSSEMRNYLCQQCAYVCHACIWIDVRESK